MFKIKGQLMGIIEIPEKKGADYVTPAHQKLQVLVNRPDGGFELMDISDKERAIKSEMVGKELTIDIKVFSPSNIYYSVAN